MPDSAQILATAIRDPIRVALDLGGDLNGLCAAATLDSALLSDGNASLPLNRFVALNQAAAAHLRAPHFGRLAGRQFDLANLGPVGEAALSAPTLGAALRLVERAFIAVQGSSELRLEVADGLAVLRYRILDGRIWPRDQDAELTLGVFAALVERVAGPDWRPAAISFEHGVSGADLDGSGAVRIPVDYEAEANTLTFEESLLSRPMPQAAPRRFRDLACALSERAGQLQRQGSLASRVRMALAARIGAGPVDQTEIARTLGLSRRSLRRHLADEGLHFADLLGECRDQSARALLDRTALGIPEIADRLGYSEASGCERAFRRRTGETPAAYRRRARTTAGGGGPAS